eukprot:4455489-Prymnesium_polylepis.1
METGVLPASRLALGLQRDRFRQLWAAERVADMWRQPAEWVALGCSFTMRRIPKADPKYTDDVLDWLSRAVARIHAAGMLE